MRQFWSWKGFVKSGPFLNEEYLTVWGKLSTSLYIMYMVGWSDCLATTLIQTCVKTRWGRCSPPCQSQSITDNRRSLPEQRQQVNMIVGWSGSTLDLLALAARYISVFWVILNKYALIECFLPINICQWRRFFANHIWLCGQFFIAIYCLVP